MHRAIFFKLLFTLSLLALSLITFSQETSFYITIPQSNASTAIDKYAERLQEEINRTNQTSYQYRFLHEEQYWAQKMAIKVRGL